MFPIQKNCLSTNENGRNILKMVSNWYWFLGRSLLPGQKYESTDAVKNRTIWRNSGLPYITLLQRNRTFWINRGSILLKVYTRQDTFAFFLICQKTNPHYKHVPKAVQSHIYFWLFCMQAPYFLSLHSLIYCRWEAVRGKVEWSPNLPCSIKIESKAESPKHLLS